MLRLLRNNCYSHILLARSFQNLGSNIQLDRLYIQLTEHWVDKIEVHMEFELKCSQDILEMLKNV